MKKNISLALAAVIMTITPYTFSDVKVTNISKNNLQISGVVQDPQGESVIRDTKIVKHGQTENFAGVTEILLLPAMQS